MELKTMKLHSLFKGLNVEIIGDYQDIQISGIALHTQDVLPGYLFISYTGKFIKEAKQNGAVAILTNCCVRLEQDVLQIIAEDFSSIMLEIINRYYPIYSNKFIKIGITGTSGKTTTSFLIQKILTSQEEHCGVIGSVGAYTRNGVIPTRLTTPDCVTVHRLLHTMKKENTSYVAMEVSSHGLDQDRVMGVDFSVAIFTNFSHEHLDYHKTMENYFFAKSKLFEELRVDGIAIVNKDDEKFENLCKKINGRMITYGLQIDADIYASNINLSLDGTSFSVEFAGEIEYIDSSLIGLFNVYNILAALGAGIACGISLQESLRRLRGYKQFFGRMERIFSDNSSSPFIFLDYAHKPHALLQVLQTLSQFQYGQLIIIFGCGGERDREKRPLMAQIAEKYADKIFITTDNPRRENPDTIIEEIMQGFTNLSKVCIDKDRRSAIRKGIKFGKKGDIVLIAGRGNETIQIFSNHTCDLQDREVIHEFLSQNL